jgi:hypothetical protein
VLVQYEYALMWEHTYFNELMLVLKKEWEVFASWFGTERDQVLNWMNHINKSRADAHAKELGAEELAYLRVCFGELERRLEVE